MLFSREEIVLDGEPRKRAELAAKNSGKDWTTSTWQRSKKAAGWQGSPSYTCLCIIVYWVKGLHFLSLILRREIILSKILKHK